MRYALISKILPIDKLTEEATRIGAKNVKVAKLVNEVFCELDEDQIASLSKIPGIDIKRLVSYTPSQILSVVRADPNTQYMNTIPMSTIPMDSVPMDAVWNIFHHIRAHFTPPLTGSGLTVAVLDTGVRKTHTSLNNKIIQEYNFSGSPSPDDVWGHGTQVAFIIAGGEHNTNITGVSPGAFIINVKVISDSGSASDEELVLGINAVCAKVQQCIEGGYRPTDPEWPNVINLSLGAPDDGDPNNPVRAACRVASSQYMLDVIASAGNDGPSMTTIRSPGTEPEVITVGAVEAPYIASIWDKSSRGPTIEGETKPDFVLWGVDIEAASDRSDTEYIAKSGTSFSAPILSGLTGLLWETGRRAYGEHWRFRWTEARKYAERFCIKPEGAPQIKGNTYGYGLPAMGTMMEQIMRGTSSRSRVTGDPGPIMAVTLMMSLIELMGN